MTKYVASFIHPDSVSGYLPASVFMLGRDPECVSLIDKFSGANVSHGRNELVSAFLSTPAYDDVDWLFMFDADVLFTPSHVRDLLGTAVRGGAGVYSGLYFGVRDGEVNPHIYAFDNEGQFRQAADYPTERTALPIAGAGAGFLLIHRDVLTGVQARRFSQAFPWFQETEAQGQRVGEDITFCLRAAECGFPLWLDTGVVLGHHKSRVLTEAEWRSGRPTVRA